jgi:hypothetical protein
MIKTTEMLRYEKLGNIIRDNSHHFFKNLNTLFEYIKILDKLNPFQLEITQLYEDIISDPTIFNEVIDIAWPYEEKEWKRGSIEAKNYENFDQNAIYVSYNQLDLSKEVLPPFKIYEISICKEKNRKTEIENFFSLKFQEKQSQIHSFLGKRETVAEDLVHIQNIILEEIGNNVYEYLSENVCFLFVEFSLSCQEVFELTKKEYDTLFESTQNFLSTLRSYNVIPVSLYNGNTSPFLSALVKYFEIKKEELFPNFPISKELLNYINDKLFFLGKLEKFHRSPFLNYTNFIFEENPYLREKIGIFYIKYDLNSIRRIEVPIFGIDYIDQIHSILVKESKKSRRNKEEMHCLSRAKRNLITRKKEKVVKYIDTILRKESVKSLKKELGLIKGIY